MDPLISTTRTSAPRTGLASRAGRPLLAVAGAGALLALTAAPAAAVTAEEPGLVRLAHLAPDTAEVDVTLTPVDRPEPLRVEDVTYGEVTDYQRLQPGFYTAALTPGDQPDAAPLLTASLEVTPGTAATVAVTGVGGGRTANVIVDDLTPPPAGQARVRLLQGASTAPVVDVTAVDGPVIAEDVAFGTATGYAPVPAQTWTLRITPRGGEAQPSTVEVALEPGSVNTLLVLDDAPALTARGVADEAPAGGTPAGTGGDDGAAESGSDTGEPGVTARGVTDATGMRRMPAGGVPAGAGSAADGGPADGLLAGIVAAAGLAGAGVTALVARRPATSGTRRR